MTSTTPDAAAAFFARCGLPSQTQLRCDALARRRYPAHVVRPVLHQGYCSYTLQVGADMILQFRPARHRLDVDVARRARAVYGPWAPLPELIGRLGPGGGPGGPDADPGAEPAGRPGHRADLYIYAMARIPGQPLSDIRSAAPDPGLYDALARDLARFFARGFHGAVPASDPTLASRIGRIGRSLRPRLQVLHSRLPARFRPAAAAALRAVPAVQALPWALTHGDVVPANVMVRPVPPAQPRLAGLLDWAEAEPLPFGIGLYGVEELLSDCVATTTTSTTTGGHEPAAARLLGVFWAELAAGVPALADPTLRATVEAARRLGLLLWHGFAFDDGRLDRVVEEGRDDDEIGRLDRFLLRGDASAPWLPAAREPSGGLAALL